MAWELYIVAVVAVFPILAGIRVIGEHERALVFRLGRFHRILEPGIRYVLPGTDRLARIDLLETLPDWRSLSENELNAKLAELALSGAARAS